MHRYSPFPLSTRFNETQNGVSNENQVRNESLYISFQMFHLGKTLNIFNTDDISILIFI